MTWENDGSDTLVSGRSSCKNVVYALASFYVGFIFGLLVVVFVRDSFLVSHALFLPILGEFNADDHVIDDWYQRYKGDFSPIFKEIDDWYEAYRHDFMPSRSGRVDESKSVRKHVETLFRDLVLVGRGRVTNDKCGKFRGWYGCLQHEKHEGDVVFARPYFNSCDKPSCPVCYRNWAVREGWSNIEPRLLAASKLFDLPVEHVVCSLPKNDYGLTYKEAKRVCRKISVACGVKGGVMIPHGNRIDRVTRVESFSPHFHIVGMVEGGYERCRRCKGGDCYACDGVEGKCYRVYRDTGYIVRVLDERESVGGTAFYELHHSSIDMSKRGFKVAVWFGCCGYSNLGVKVEKRRLLCPKCGSQCGFLDYVGSKHLVIDKNSPDFKRELFVEFLEAGQPAWKVKEFEPRGDDVR
jgi:hypothetical protein